MLLAAKTPHLKSRTCVESCVCIEFWYLPPHDHVIGSVPIFSCLPMLPFVVRDHARCRVEDMLAACRSPHHWSSAQVLLLLPLRSMALRAALRLAALAQRETRADSIQGKQRLAEEFGGDEGEPGAGQRGRGGVAPDKPAEHAALFAGNPDDHFRFGVKITRCGRQVGPLGCSFLNCLLTHAGTSA